MGMKENIAFDGMKRMAAEPGCSAPSFQSVRPMLSIPAKENKLPFPFPLAFLLGLHSIIINHISSYTLHPQSEAKTT